MLENGIKEVTIYSKRTSKRVLNVRVNGTLNDLAGLIFMIQFHLKFNLVKFWCKVMKSGEVCIN